MELRRIDNGVHDGSVDERVQTMWAAVPGHEYMTSAQAARVLGVGPTSIKRWSDSGLLACVRTPGKHRRFVRTEIERFLKDRGGLPGPEPDHIHAWIGFLGTESGPSEVHAALLRERSRAGSWWRVADVLGPVLSELARRRAVGEITALQEEAACERLARGIARSCESLSVPAGAPRCALATLDGDEQAIPMALCELSLREAGWSSVRVERATAGEEIGRLAAQRAIEMAALSASADAQRERLQTLANELGRVCRENGVTLVFAGAGPWPEGGLARRIHAFSELHDVIGDPVH